MMPRARVLRRVRGFLVLKGVLGTEGACFAGV
jgi:hypothetical protein